MVYNGERSLDKFTSKRITLPTAKCVYSGALLCALPVVLFLQVTLRPYLNRLGLNDCATF